MLAIRSMSGADLPLGMRLCRQAGWNQTEADWRRFLALQPDGCFVAELDGVAVGTTATFLFGPVAWIAAVLVDEACRGRGVGRALMVQALAFVDSRAVRTVRLDATPVGQPLYESLGFSEQYRLARYAGVLAPTEATAGVETAARAQWPALADLDALVTQTDRRRLIHRLFNEQPDEVRVVNRDGGIAGFRAVREGARALLLGPCIAAPDVGPALFADACHRHAGRDVYIDVPLANKPACRLAESYGLIVQRHLTRMCRGEMLCERVAWLWASSGPEKG